MYECYGLVLAPNAMVLFIPLSCVLLLTCVCLKAGESVVEVGIPSSAHRQASLVLLLLLLAALQD